MARAHAAAHPSSLVGRRRRGKRSQFFIDLITIHYAHSLLTKIRLVRSHSSLRTSLLLAAAAACGLCVGRGLRAGAAVVGGSMADGGSMEVVRGRRV